MAEPLRAIILAAGMGRRMGRPKALLPWGDRTLVSAHAHHALAAGASSVCVVTRSTIAAEIPALPEGARLCLSLEEDSLGAAGSLVAALRSLEDYTEHRFAICPVDVDPAAWTCLRSLSRALDDDSALAARPSIAARRGHPVLVRGRVLEPYARGLAPPLREVLRALEDGSVRDVSVTDAAVLTDLDTPEEWAAHNPR